MTEYDTQRPNDCFPDEPIGDCALCGKPAWALDETLAAPLCPDHKAQERTWMANRDSDPPTPGNPDGSDGGGGNATRDALYYMEVARTTDYAQWLAKRAAHALSSAPPSAAVSDTSSVPSSRQCAGQAGAPTEAASPHASVLAPGTCAHLDTCDTSSCPSCDPPYSDGALLAGAFHDDPADFLTSFCASAEHEQVRVVASVAAFCRCQPTTISALFDATRQRMALLETCHRIF